MYKLMYKRDFEKKYVGLLESECVSSKLLLYISQQKEVKNW